MKPALANVVAEVGVIASHQMSLVMHEMAVVVVAVEEQRHRVTKSIASSPVLIEYQE